MDPDTEARAREIELAARAQSRRPWPRGLWVAAIVVALVCVVGLAIAWIQDGDTVAKHTLDRPATSHESGLWLGVLVGLGLGIAIGGVLAARGRR